MNPSTLRARPTGVGVAACVVSLCLVLSACDSSGGGNQELGALLGVEVSPAEATVASGATRQFTATGIYEQGEADISGDVAWFSSRSAIASIASGGTATGAGCGLSGIVAFDEAAELSGGAVLGVSSCTAVGDPTPVEISSGSFYSGEVDTGTSYYAAAVDSATYGYTFYLDSMSDDVDLAVFTDASLTTPDGSCFALSRYGDEWCSIPDPGGAGTRYVTVTGTNAFVGSAYRLYYVTNFGPSESILPSPASEGTVASPVTATDPFQSGAPFVGQVDAADSSYYVSRAIPGVPTGVAILGDASTDAALPQDVDLYVYRDSGFSDLACSSTRSGAVNEVCTATPIVQNLWMRATPRASGTFFHLLFLADEGSVSRPVPLAGDKYNLGTVRSGESFYAVAVDSGSTYTVGFGDYLSGPVTLRLFGTDATFGTPACTEAWTPAADFRSLPGGNTCEITPAGSRMYVSVEADSGAGAFFHLTVLSGGR